MVISESTQSLREYIRLLTEAFHDKYFTENLRGVLGDSALELLSKMGSQLGYGNERVVFSFGQDAVIKFEPAYEMYDEQVDEKFTRLETMRDQGVLDVTGMGVVRYVSEDGEDVPFALWYTMPRYDPLPRHRHVADTIDDVVMGRLDLADVSDPVLRNFLGEYIRLGNDLGIDVDGQNVMLDKDGAYVISDV